MTTRHLAMTLARARCALETLAMTVAPSPSALLAPRERQVLQHLADGYSYEQVGLLLEISLASVRTYVRRTYGKLGVHTKSEATIVAMRAGLLR